MVTRWEHSSSQQGRYDACYCNFVMILSLMIFCFILHTMWLAECWRYTYMYTKKTTEAERGSAANGFCFGLSFFRFFEFGVFVEEH